VQDRGHGSPVPLRGGGGQKWKGGRGKRRPYGEGAAKCGRVGAAKCETEGTGVPCPYEGFGGRQRAR
jgi:hypothetical protein